MIDHYTPITRLFGLFALIYALLVSWSPSVLAQNPQYDTAATAYQNRDYALAETTWTELADAGNANAQYALAVMHLKSETQTPDFVTAHHWLKKASAQNHVTAMFNLGVSYWEGVGIKVDKQAALKWWEAAAQHNSSGAQFNLGLAYYIGDGRKRNLQQALYWISKAETNGHPQASQLLEAIKREQPNAVATPLAAPAISPTPNRPKASKVERSTEQPSIPKMEPEVPKNHVNIEDKTPQVSAETKTSDTDGAVPSKVGLKTFWQTKDMVSSIRARPSPDAIELKTLTSNTPLKVSKEKGEWLKIYVPGNYAVWMHGDFVKQADGQTDAIVTGTNVNVRPIPAINKTDAAPVGQLNTGDKVTVLLRRDEWVQVLPARPLPAWIQAHDTLKFRASPEQHAENWSRHAQ